MAESAMADSRSIQIFSRVADFADAYDGYVLDLWGVIHDGIKPYPGAADCLAALKARGKRIVLLSNAPRRAQSVIDGMARMGIARDLFDDALSSGEAAWQALRARADEAHRALGARCYHMGPERDRGMLDGLDLEEAARPKDASFILNTGVDMDHETLADYEDALVEGARAGVPMLCANPDLEVIRGGARVVCAGALARRYEELGGATLYHGKPHAPVYERCMALMGDVDRLHVVAIGDSLRTDIAGALAAGLDSVFVTGGIHGEELGLAPGEVPEPARLVTLCRRAGWVPNGAVPHFQW
jgi:HAD superfamily hydrolase (TIGR01459 family)